MATIKSLRFDLSSSWDGAGVRQAKTDLDTLKATIDELNAKSVSVKITADTAQAKSSIDELKADTDTLGNKAVSIKMDTAQATTSIDEIKAKMDDLTRLRKAQVNADLTGDATVRATLDELVKDRKAEIKADLQDLGTSAKLDLLSRDRYAKIIVEADKAPLDELKSSLDDVKSKFDWASSGAANLATGILTIGPSVIPLTAAVVGFGGAFLSSFGSASLALVPFGASLFGTYTAVKNLSTTLDPLNSQLDQQKQALAQLTPGTAAYTTAAQQVAQTQQQINQAMASATPIERALYGDLQNLQSAWQSFQQQAEKFTGPIIAAAFQAVTGAIQHMLPLVAAVAPMFQQIMDKAAAFANSNGMTQFVNWVIAVGVPNLKNIISTVGNLLSTIGSIFKAFAQDGVGLTQALADLTARMAAWAGAEGGMQRFADAIRQEWPAVKALIENVGTAIGNIIKALAGFGPASLGGLIMMTGLLKELSPGELQALAIGFLAIKAAVAFAPIVSALVTAFNALKVAMAGVAVEETAVEAVSGVAGAASAATAGATATAGAASKIGTALGSVATAVGGGGVAIAAGAAVGAAAIGIGIAALAQSIQQHSDQAAGIVRHADGSFSAATTASGQHVSQSFTNMANTVSHAGTATGATVQDMGGAIASRFGSYQQNFSNANQKLSATMGLLAHSPDQAASDFAQATGLFLAQQHADVAKMGAQVQASGKSLSDQTSQALLSAFQGGAKATQQGAQGLVQAFNTSASQAWSQMQNTTKTDYSSLGNSMKGYENDLANGRIQNASGDIQKVKSAMQQFESDYASGRITTTQAQIQKVSADVTAFYAAQSSGDSQKEQAAIQKLFADTQAAYNNGANAADAAQVAADNKMWADVQQSGTAAAAAAGAAIAAAISNAMAFAQSAAGKAATGGTGSIGTGVPGSGHGTTVSTGGLMLHGAVIRRAPGGFVSGAGTATSDSIPAMLSNGEFVMNAKAVGHYGVGTMHAMNQMRLAGGGYVGFADGGAATGAGSTGNSLSIPSPTQPMAASLVAGFSDMSQQGRDATNTMFDTFRQANQQGWERLGDGMRVDMSSYVQQGMAQQQTSISGQMASDYRQKFAQFAQANTTVHQTAITGQMQPDYQTKFTAFASANKTVHQTQVNGQMQSDYQTKFTAFATANKNVHQTQITGQMQSDYNTKFTGFANANKTVHQAQITGQMTPDYNQKFTAYAAANKTVHAAQITGQMQPDYQTKFTGYVTASNQTQTTGITGIQTTFQGHFNSMSTASSGTVTSDISSIGSAAASAASSALGRAQSAVSSAASSMGGSFSFAGGGFVSGAGTGTSDSIPAMLSNGEFVVNAKSTSRNIGLLHAINRQRFASGGIVTPGGGSSTAVQAVSIMQGTNGPVVSSGGGMAGVAAVGPGYETSGSGAVSAVTENGLGGMDIGTMKKIVAEINANKAKAAAAAAAAAGAAAGAPYTGGGSLTAWLQAAGIPQSEWGAFQTLIMAESGGNPNAVDPILVLGQNATGLVQMLPSTFAAYGGGNIYNPVDNLKASAAYIAATYGSINNIPGLGTGSYGGYFTGTNNASKGWSWVGERGPELMNFGGGEQVDPTDRITDAISQLGQGASGDVSINMPVTITAGGQPGDVANEMQDQVMPMLDQALRQRVGARWK